VEVSYVGGETDLYSVPVGVSTGRAADDIADSHSDAVLTRLQIDGDDAVLHDALVDDAMSLCLLDGMVAGARWNGEHGVANASLLGYTLEEGSPKVGRISAEQSNSSVTFGGKLVLKLFRRLDQGPNPDFEVSRFLTGPAGFGNVPKVNGAMEYRGSDDVYTLA